MTNLSRHSDPVTSHLAAFNFTADGKLKTHVDRIIAGVTLHPGLTAGELGQRIGLTQVQVLRRLWDIPEVRRGEVRICKVVDSLSLTWDLAEPPAETQGELFQRDFGGDYD